MYHHLVLPHAPNCYSTAGEECEQVPVSGTWYSDYRKKNCNQSKLEHGQMNNIRIFAQLLPYIISHIYPYICRRVLRFDRTIAPSFYFISIMSSSSLPEPLHVVIAPNAYKECLSATQVGQHLEAGVLAACRAYNVKVRTTIVGLADGGDGTMELLVEACDGRIVEHKANDPLGREITTRYGLLFQDKMAVIEMADASGLWRLSAEEKDPRRTTSTGFGQSLMHVIEHHGDSLERIMLCIGGSATNDGGIGLAYSLGFRFYDAEHNELEPVGASLQSICTYSMPAQAIVDKLKKIDIQVACDVTNPLLGPKGATAVYGPQKGVTTQEAHDELESGLANLAGLWKTELKHNIADIPGAGAAGGMGAGLIAFCGASLKSGFDLVADTVKLRDALRDSVTFVLTGEGRIDESTIHGKVPAGVARLAKEYKVPCYAVAGSKATTFPTELYECGLSAVFSIAPGPITLVESTANAPQLLQAAAEQISRVVLSTRL
jgi:glycerate 2-kinase